MSNLRQYSVDGANNSSGGTSRSLIPCSCAYRETAPSSRRFGSIP